MKFYKLNYFYVITKIKEHTSIKQDLLKMIDDIPVSSMKNISKTDWNLPKGKPRPYLNKFYSIIDPYLTRMAKQMRCKQWKIDNGWFQQYNYNDTHTWHNHTNSNFSNVYYLELPEKMIKTEFYDILDTKIINTMNIEEGDLITFPSSLLHRSPKNIAKKRKTIISFNSNFENVDLTI